MQKIHIVLEKGQKVFFTSDLHLEHKNVLQFCNRPFASTKEMTEAIIRNWNSVVGENDIVFDLGDMFWFKSRHAIKRVVDRLNGFIYKIAGNHDMDGKTLFELCYTNKIKPMDDVVCLLLEDQTGKTYEIWLTHFPQATWPHWKHGSINLFGHIHSGPVSNNEVDIIGEDLILKDGLQYDVGVDNNNYTPVSLEQVLSILESQMKF